MKFNLFTVLLCFFVFSGCSEKDQELMDLNIYPIDSPEDILLTFSEPLFSARLHTYKSVGDKLYYVRMDPGGNITIINTQSETQEHFKVPDEGPFAINFLAGVYLVDEEKILVFGATKGVFFDFDGVPISQFKYGAGVKDIEIPEGYFVSVDPNYPVTGEKDIVYLTIVKEDDDMFSFPYAYEGSLLGKLNLSTLQVDPLNVLHENLGTFYGGLHRVNSVYHEGKLYVTFDYSPNIHVYSDQGDLVKSIVVPPAFNTVNTPYVGSADPMETIAHMTSSLAYGRLLFDSSGDDVYQLMIVPSLDKPGKTRVGAIRKFDRNFKLFKEGRLPKYSVPSNAFVKGGYLHFAYGRSSLGENQIYYRTLN